LQVALTTFVFLVERLLFAAPSPRPRSEELPCGHDEQREDGKKRSMRIIDLPNELLEMVLSYLTFAALGRLVSSRTALSTVAGQVAKKRVDADKVLKDAAMWFQFGENEDCCSECLNERTHTPTHDTPNHAEDANRTIMGCPGAT
jgi:hypothetical protein